MLLDIVIPLSLLHFHSAGSIVRESAKIAGKKLDWRQKIAEIKDVIKDYFSKVFSTPQKHPFTDIVNDRVLSRKLRNLDKNICYNMHGSILGGVIEGKVLFKSYNNYSYLVI